MRAPPIWEAYEPSDTRVGRYKSGRKAIKYVDPSELVPKNGRIGCAARDAMLNDMLDGFANGMVRTAPSQTADPP